jgi:hypothetical protein
MVPPREVASYIKTSGGSRIDVVAGVQHGGVHIEAG